MTKRQSHSVGGLTFATKKALLAHIQSILYTYNTTDAVSQEHQEFLVDLLGRHPNVGEKIGVGVRSMHVRSDGHGGQCFELVRHDGSSTDWSFMVCLRPPPLGADFYAACRCAVRDQVEAYKASRFGRFATAICDISGEEVLRESSHVDHVPPLTFRKLADDFSVVHGIDPATEPVLGMGDGDTQKYLANERTRSLWSAYHRTNARLRLLDAHVHRTQPRA